MNSILNVPLPIVTSLEDLVLYLSLPVNILCTLAGQSHDRDVGSHLSFETLATATSLQEWHAQLTTRLEQH